MPEEPLRIEVVWSCPVCKESAMGLYEGPNDAEKVLRWAQEAHKRLDSLCPYKFKSVEIQPMRPQK